MLKITNEATLNKGLIRRSKVRGEMRTVKFNMPGEGKVVVSGTRIVVVKGELYSPDISVVTSREVVGHGALDTSLLVKRNKSESRSDGDEL